MQIFTYIQGVQHNLIGDISDNGTALFSGGEDAEMPIADSSYRFSEIMGDDNCIINFSLPVFYEFPIGCFVVVEYTAYTLLELGQVTKQNERWYDYALTFESPAKQLSRYKFRNYVDGRLNFTITAQPQEFLDHICRNMNMDGRDSGWTVGDCIVSSEKTQSFSHNTVADALNSVAQLFETEWEIVGKRISLRKIEYNKTNPLTLSYGMGNGFKSGITRQLSDEKAVDVLWVVGGDRNIDGRKYTYRKDGEVYHANTLRLPRNSRFVYIPSNGEPDASGKIDRGQLFTLAEWNAKSAAERGAYTEFMAVKTDKDGFGVERETRINNGYEESLEATDIYPHKVLQVAKAECVDAENRFWDITVKTADGSPIPDYNECLIGGVTVTTVFNSGMLSGKEFNIANQGTDENPKCYDPALRIFKIQPTEIDGIVMPDLPTENDPEYIESGLPSGTGYVPHRNDEFAIFHVFLPNQYVEEAERELLLTACEYLWKHGEVEVEFNGTVDGIWAKDNWENIFPYIKLGGYVRFYDKHILNGSNGKLMRILNIKQYINNPHSPEITLSNSSVSQGVSAEIKKIPQNQVAAMAEIDRQVSYTKRSFEDTKDMQQILKEAFVDQGDYFSSSITPVSVETMQMIVGSEDLQFAFGSVDAYELIEERKKVTRFTEFNYNPSYADGQLTCAKVQMRHYSYSSHRGEITAATDAVFPYWEVGLRTFAVTNPSQAYYLYAVCAKTATEPNNLGFLTEGNAFALETAPHAHTNERYYFLVGILNREKDGTRSFASLYGYTEVLGNRVTTGRIVSADGQTWFDLTTGEIRTNHSIKFSWQGDEQDLADAFDRVSNTADEANTLAVTVQNNLKNLQIGGRNLVFNSATMPAGNGRKSWRASGGTVTHVGLTNPPIDGISGAIRVTNNSSASARVGMAQDYIYGDYKEGDKLTISFYMRASTTVETTGIAIEPYWRESAKYAANYDSNITTITTQWQRVYGTATIVGNWTGEASLGYAYLTVPSGGWFEVCGMKVEQGEVPTAWSPAPEDLDEKAEMARRLAEASQLVSQGYMLYRDPEFHEGSNSVKVYNNEGNGKVTHARITDSTAANSVAPKDGNHYVIRITTNGTAKPACGGFYFGNASRANAIFVYHIRAKIPVGYYIQYNYNAHGTGAQQIWCTEQDGDNTYRDYVLLNRCGATGTFSSVGFFSLVPYNGYSATSVTWYLAYATCFDCTAHESLKQAFSNSTDITGGVVLSNVIQVRNNSNTITAGMSGMNPNGVGKNPRFWAGGDFTKATAAAGESAADVHSTNLPILLLDGGYNSNIGIFKILPDAIAVMKTGQVVRISTNSYSSEVSNFAPLSPTTRSLTSALINWTNTSSWTASSSWSIGTLPKTSSFFITINSAVFNPVLSETYQIIGSGSSGFTVSFTAVCKVSVAGQTKTILSNTAHTTGAANTNPQNPQVFNPSLNLRWTSSSVTFDINGTAGAAITLTTELRVSTSGGSGSLVRRANQCNIYGSALTATLKERRSCFLLANGGMAIGYDSSNYFKAQINGSAAIDFRGTSFKMNGYDFVKTASKTVYPTGGGYITVVRLGNLVMCKIGELPYRQREIPWVPVGFRPVTSASFLAYTTNKNDYVYNCYVGTNGAVYLPAQYPTDTVCWGSVTYICNEAYP